MNDGFKQRLVGAVVLSSLVLILWPIVFSQSTGPVVDKRSQIPKAPVFEKYTVPKPDRPVSIEPIVGTVEPVNPIGQVDMVGQADSVEQVDDNASLASIPVVEPKRPMARLKQPPKTQQLDKKGVPIAWVLQVASFRKQQNATELKTALQKKGYKAYTRRIKRGSTESVRVYVGPKLSKQAFTKDKIDIDKAFKVQSLIVRFTQ